VSLTPGERRSADEIRAHYLVERELARRLRDAGRDERRALYGVVYDELFRRVPSHPQLSEKHEAEGRQREAARQLGMFERYLHPDAAFLEVGAGDLAVSLAVADRVRKVFAVEVSHEVTADLQLPPNVELVMSDGVSVEVTPGSVDVAYSHQLMEHLHPDDAREQLENIHAALAPGGVYVCVTPNRLSGPHDVSKYFDDVASGFHLREYTIAELTELFRSVGFTGVRALVGGRGSYVAAPILPLRAYEAAFSAGPPRLRRALARLVPFSVLLGVGVVGRKPGA
jgi:SAM-dependent methyltransferase